MGVHIYTAPLQPATRFVDHRGWKPVWLRCKPRHVLWTDCCHRLRWAKYLHTQVFGDGIRYWCRPGHGCKKQEAR